MQGLRIFRIVGIESLHQIRIVGFLISDGGVGTMTRIHGGRVGKGKQFLFDARDESLVVAAPKVGASYAVTEKHIARECDPGLCTVENKPSG